MRSRNAPEIRVDTRSSQLIPQSHMRDYFNFHRFLSILQSSIFLDLCIISFEFGEIMIFSPLKNTLLFILFTCCCVHILGGEVGPVRVSVSLQCHMGNRGVSAGRQQGKVGHVIFLQNSFQN